MILFILLIFILIPDQAFAWGPAAHLEYAGLSLASLSTFAPMVKLALTHYKEHFLYGSVAADITLGKNLRGYNYNCHNWKVALDLLHNKTSDQKQQAFMLGYLGHLAADTVAHNLYVPFKLIRSWNSRLKNHVYWEMRFDLTVPDSYWKQMQDLCDNRYIECDLILESHLKRTFFSFGTNKKIFNGLLMLQQIEKYKILASNYAAKTDWTLDEEDVRFYKKMAVDAVVDFLRNLEKSYVVKSDPTGKSKMVYARSLIKSFRQAKRQKIFGLNEQKRILPLIKQSMVHSIYKPHVLPQLSDLIIENSNVTI